MRLRRPPGVSYPKRPRARSILAAAPHSGGLIGKPSDQVGPGAAVYHLPATNARTRGISRSTILEQKKYWCIARGPSVTTATNAVAIGQNLPARTPASAVFTSI